MKKSEAVESAALIGFILLTYGAGKQVVQKLGEADLEVNSHGIYHIDKTTCSDGSVIREEKIIVHFNTPGKNRVQSVLPPPSCESKG